MPCGYAICGACVTFQTFRLFGLCVQLSGCGWVAERRPSKLCYLPCARNNNPSTPPIAGVAARWDEVDYAHRTIVWRICSLSCSVDRTTVSMDPLDIVCFEGRSYRVVHAASCFNQSVRAACAPAANSSCLLSDTLSVRESWLEEVEHFHKRAGDLRPATSFVIYYLSVHRVTFTNETLVRSVEKITKQRRRAT